MPQPLHKRKPPADYQHKIEHVNVVHTILQDSTLKKAEHCKGIGFHALGLPHVLLTTLHLQATVQGPPMPSASPRWCRVQSGNSASKTKSAKRHGSDPKLAAPPAGRFGYLSHSSPDQPFTFHGAGPRVHLPSTCEHRGCNRHRHGQRQYKDVPDPGRLVHPTIPPRETFKGKLQCYPLV